MCFNPSTHGVKDFAKGCLVLKYLHKAFSKFFLMPGGGASSNIYTPYGIINEAYDWTNQVTPNSAGTISTYINYVTISFKHSK